MGACRFREMFGFCLLSVAAASWLPSSAVERGPCALRSAARCPEVCSRALGPAIAVSLWWSPPLLLRRSSTGFGASLSLLSVVGATCLWCSSVRGGWVRGFRVRWLGLPRCTSRWLLTGESECVRAPEICCLEVKASGGRATSPPLPAWHREPSLTPAPTHGGPHGRRERCGGVAWAPPCVGHCCSFRLRVVRF